MRICYILHQFLPRYFTGTEQYVFAISREMLRRGHDVEVFTLDPQFGDEENPFVEEALEVEGVSVTRVHFWQPLHRDVHRLEYRHPFMALRFGSYLGRVRPDVAHFFHLRFLGADLIDEARRRAIPAAVHLMDYWFVCPNVTLTRRDGALCDGPPEGGLGCIPCMAPQLDRQIEDLELRPHLAKLRQLAPPPSTPGRSLAARAATFAERPSYLRRRLLRADKVFAPSRFLADVFVQNGIERAAIELMPYGVDTSRLDGAGTGREPPSSLVLGFMGSISPHKGLHVLLEALTRVQGAVELSVHGRTSDFPDYAQRMQELAATGDRVTFHGPFPPDRLGAVLSTISVLVVPSLWYENTPFVILEALAAGVPVIATDLGGLSEIVRDGENGELFARGDADDLAHRLQRLADRPERLVGYRAACGRVRTLVENVDDLERHYRALHAKSR